MKYGRRGIRIAVLLAAGTTVLTYSAYRHDIQAARARISTGSRVLNTACGPIEYADVGTGLPVLAIHGAGGGFDQGVEFMRPLAGSGIRVIAPSRFGYLRTPLPADASPMAQADAHACLLDALNLRKVAVIGVSAGAPSAMQLCLRHPDRCSALVLLSGLTYNPRPAGEAPKTKPSVVAQFLMNATLRSDFVFWLLTKIAPETMVKVVLATPTGDFKNANREEQERVLRLLSCILPISLRVSGLRNDLAIAASLRRYELERLSVPALVVNAEDDLFGFYEAGQYTAQQIPHARFVGYPSGGHLLVGRGESVSLELAEFLKKSCATDVAAAR